MTTLTTATPAETETRKTTPCFSLVQLYYPSIHTYSIYLCIQSIHPIQSTKPSHPTNNSKLKKYIYIICGVSSFWLCVISLSFWNFISNKLFLIHNTTHSKTFKTLMIMLMRRGSIAIDDDHSDDLHEIKYLWDLLFKSRPTNLLS